MRLGFQIVVILYPYAPTATRIGQGVFIEGQIRPLSEGVGPNASHFWTFYITTCTHYDKHILDGDETR